jgi:hypothetical protein
MFTGSHAFLGGIEDRRYKENLVNNKQQLMSLKADLRREM